MKKVKCEIVVEVPDEIEDVSEYLNDCRFCVYADNHDDICTEVRDYQEIEEG